MTYESEYEQIRILLDKYWRCATTIEEERELRRFFSGSRIPPEWEPYRAWFRSEQAEYLPPLGPEFDRRVMASIRQEKRRAYHRRLLYGGGFLLFLLLILFLWILFRPCIEGGG